MNMDNIRIVTRNVGVAGERLHTKFVWLNIEITGRIL